MARVLMMLVGGCEAYTLLTVPHAGVQSMRNTMMQMEEMQIDRPDFAFGGRQSAIGFQGGTGSGFGTDAPVQADYRGVNGNDDYRFGSSQTVNSIGFRGGNGNGLANEATQKYVINDGANPNDDYRFGSGRTAVGFQGGADSGMGGDVQVKRIVNSGPNQNDDFRFGSGRVTGRYSNLGGA